MYFFYHLSSNSGRGNSANQLNSGKGGTSKLAVLKENTKGKNVASSRSLHAQLQNFESCSSHPGHSSVTGCRTILPKKRRINTDEHLKIANMKCSLCIKASMGGVFPLHFHR